MFDAIQNLAETHGGRSALDRPDLWDRNDFLREQRLWHLNCLRHDLHPWDLHDQHNRDIDHLIISVLQLGNLDGLLNHPVHVGLSLRHDRDVDDIFGELQRWNINVLGHLVDLLLGDVFSASTVSTTC